MVVECRHGHKNRIPDTPVPGRDYRCGRCKESIHVVWAASPSDTTPYSAHRLRLNPEGSPISKVPAIACVILLTLAAFGKWPYGFYMFLRFVTFGSAAYLVWASNELKRRVWVWLMGVTAVLFNPIIPIRMGRSIWSYLDLVAALLFGVSLLSIRVSNARRSGQRE